MENALTVLTTYPPKVPIVINKVLMTNNTAPVEDRPLLLSHANGGRQITAIKIDKNKGVKIGAAAFMPAITIQNAANEIRRGIRLTGISYINNVLRKGFGNTL